MHKAQRLVHLMMLVNEKKTFTIRQMAEACGVSRRTMIRDLMELGELGVPLYAEPGAAGGYRVLRERVLPPISFTENEAMALFFACQSLQYYKTLPFEREAASALSKFRSSLSGDLKDKLDKLQERLMFWVPPQEADAPHLKGLLDAALDGRIVRIVYDGNERAGERTIQPLGVYAMNGLWYVQAHCFEREAPRVFRADRVLALTVPDDQSRRLPPDRAPMNREPPRAGAGVPDGTKPLVLEARLTKGGARRCRTDVWLAEALTVREDGTGSLRRTMDASFVPWAIRFFLGLGSDAEVLGPPEVRDGIREELRKLRAVYDEPGGGEI